MYRKIFESRIIHITNKHHKKLLERFDRNNFVERINPLLYPFPTMVNSAPCALCKSFFHRSRTGNCGCGKCPMAIFGNGYCFGCTYVMSKLSMTNDICASVAYITYRCVNREAAIRSLKIITDFLKSFEKE